MLYHSVFGSRFFPNDRTNKWEANMYSLFALIPLVQQFQACRAMDWVGNDCATDRS